MEIKRNEGNLKNKIILLGLITLCILILFSCSKKKLEIIKVDQSYEEENVIISDSESQEEIKPIESLTSYLNNYSSIVNVSRYNDFEDLGLLESSLGDKKIFLTGEMHGIKLNTVLRMKFLRYFKLKTNFKYYLSEISPSMAYFINKFLITGDEEILKDLYANLEHTFEWTQENYNHWIDLYDYNNTLNKKDEIVVIGIDIEFQPQTTFKCLNDILSNKTPNTEIESIASEIRKTNKNFSNYSYKELYNTSLDIKQSLEENERLYEELLGDEYKIFKLVNQNFINSTDIADQRENSINWNNSRDKMIYANFVEIDSDLEDASYFGQWGLDHVYQSKISGITYFATHLNSNKSKYKNQVLSIAYNYQDCEVLSINKDGTYSDRKTVYKFPFITSSELTIEDEVTLYKLNSVDSPLSNLLMRDIRTFITTENNVTEFIQYMVIIKGSASSTPLRKFYNK